MHDDVRLGGILWVLTEALLVLASLLALFVVVDVVRRHLQAKATDASGRSIVPYALSEGGFLLLMLLVQFTPLPPVFSAAMLVLVPLSIAFGVAYLLRVVYPRGVNPHEGQETPAEE